MRVATSFQTVALCWSRAGKGIKTNIFPRDVISSFWSTNPSYLDEFDASFGVVFGTLSKHSIYWTDLRGFVTGKNTNGAIRFDFCRIWLRRASASCFIARMTSLPVPLRSISPRHRGRQECCWFISAACISLSTSNHSLCV